MCDTPFKTPLPYSTPTSKDYYTPKAFTEKTDSDESVSSNGSEGSGSSGFTGSSNDLTIVAIFDDLMRLVKQCRNNKLEDAFISYVDQSRLLYDYLRATTTECSKLQNIIDLKVHESSEKDLEMKKARQIIDQQKRKISKISREKEELEELLDQVKELFKDQRSKLADDTREKLSFLNMGRKSGDANGLKNLSAIPEINSTGSVLSDLSITKSEDDLDISRGKWNKHRSSAGGAAEPASKRRKSSNTKVVEISHTDTVRATTTLTVPKQGPITATSIIESIPKPGSNGVSDGQTTSDEGYTASDQNGPPHHMVFDSWAKGPRKPDRQHFHGRLHNLQQKTIVMPVACTCCEERIRFGKRALKCSDCRSVCHLECKEQLALPCVPLANTPNHRNVAGIISDYTPTTPPMVPALIVHSVKEVESRGLNELGLYRIPGSEKDVKALKEKFLRGRGSPCLTQVDVHVICGCIKDFLRSLTEPIITYNLWKDFIQAAEAKDEQDRQPALCDCISQLPQPNRDTLAYMILHLQKIAGSKECKMPIENLAKVFGPTIVGFSSDDVLPNNLLIETRQQINVMEHLIRIPSDYWSSFINVVTTYNTGRLQQTPSTDSLLRPANRIFTTPISAMRTPRKHKTFATPPYYK